MKTPSRRSFLTLSAVGVSGILAGCLDDIAADEVLGSNDDTFEEYTDVEGNLRFSNAALDIDSQATFGIDFPENIVETEESPIIIEFELTNNRDEGIFISDSRDVFFNYVSDSENQYILLPDAQNPSISGYRDGCWRVTDTPTQTTDLQTESIPAGQSLTRRVAIVQHTPVLASCLEPPEKLTFQTSFYIHSERGVRQGEFVTAKLTLQR